MLRTMRIQNFKSWADTGEMRLASITGFFGANSSGKTSLLQLPLLLKQTAESSDRAQVLHLGDKNSLVNLGTFGDAVRGHALDRALEWSLAWSLPQPLKPKNPEHAGEPLFSAEEVVYSASVSARRNGSGSHPAVDWFKYRLDVPSSDARQMAFGLRRSRKGIKDAWITAVYKGDRTWLSELVKTNFYNKAIN